MGMEWSSFAMLLIVVALASACQNLTGFAFALIFVGLAGALHLLPIADAANVAGLLSLVNGVVYLRSHPFKPRWDLLKPMLISSVIGVIGGVLVAANLNVIVPAIEHFFGTRFLPADVYLISEMPSKVLLGDVASIGLIALLLAFTATVFPSWQASRINPAEALRYE